MLKNIPKIELHLHLDGSLDIDFIKEKYGLSNEDIKNKMIADEKCIDLNDYLTKFDYPLSIMQTKEELINSTKNLISKLIIYARKMGWYNELLFVNYYNNIL